MGIFEEIEQHYPKIIQQMQDTFTSHEFILKFAHQHQGLYIQALAEYADNDALFMIVHGRLAKAGEGSSQF